jgi:hypothetical protein
MKRTLPGTLGALVILATAVLFAPGAVGSSDLPGAVYLLTNSPVGNAVLVYGHGGDGSLTPAGSFATVAVSVDSRFLYALVNATNSIAGFAIGADGWLDPLPPLTGNPAGLAGLAASPPAPATAVRSPPTRSWRANA